MFWMDHTAHPDIETLDHHLAGRLPERASKDVREHIVSCEDCQRIVTARLAIKLGLVRVGPHKPIWLD
jgi:hypothetical protein